MRSIAQEEPEKSRKLKYVISLLKRLYFFTGMLIFFGNQKESKWRTVPTTLNLALRTYDIPKYA